VRAATGAEGILAEVASFETSHMTYPYGIHLAQLRLHPETSGITVERLLAAADVGRVANPMLVAGQLAGGAGEGPGCAVAGGSRAEARGERRRCGSAAS